MKKITIIAYSAFLLIILINLVFYKRLSITTVLSDWNSTPVVDKSQFDFVPPAGTQAIEFMPLEPTGGKS